MTIEQAWTIVLEHYHDALPPELQWTSKMADVCSGRLDYGLHTKCGSSNMHGYHHIPVPAPALTDAAAMAVARALYKRESHFSFRLSALVLRNDLDLRDAIILAAAELAHKERAK